MISFMSLFLFLLLYLFGSRKKFDYNVAQSSIISQSEGKLPLFKRNHYTQKKLSGYMLRNIDLL